MSKRICQGCGSELDEDSLFCPSCGREVAIRKCQACGEPIPDGSNFCPGCGKEISAHVCESCGAPIPEGSRLCPNCEEKARREVEAAREKARQEEEAVHKSQEAALLAQKEAEAIAREKARQEAEAAREKAKQEQEAARKAQEDALLARREAEAAREQARQEKEEAKERTSPPVVEKERLSQASSASHSHSLRKWLFIAGGIVLILALAGILYFYVFNKPNPEQDDTTTDTTEITDTTDTTDTTEITGTTDTTETTDTTATSQTLSEVLARTAEIVSVRYDTQVTRPGTSSFTMRTWVENNKVKIRKPEEGEIVIILIDNDAQTVYRFVPSQNTATRMPYPSPARTAIEDAESILNYNPEFTGTETIDGKSCLVIEYLVSGAPTKMWLWQDYGLPLRVETTVPAGIAIVETSNIDFAHIPDSTFELPAGVQIIQ